MDRGIAKRILNTEDGRLLAEYIASEMMALDQVSDIKTGEPSVVALETEARKQALVVLNRIFGTLIAGREEKPEGVDQSEYVV